MKCRFVLFFQAEDGIRDLVRSRGLGDVYKRQDEDDADDAQATITLEVEVLGIQVRELPELTDEWVADATEFETVAELRDDIVDRMSGQARDRAQSQVRNELATALVELSLIHISEPTRPY